MRDFVYFNFNNIAAKLDCQPVPGFRSVQTSEKGERAVEKQKKKI